VENDANQSRNFESNSIETGAGGSLHDSSTMLKSESWGSSRHEVFFFNLPNPTSRTMALGSTQPLTEITTRNLPECKKRTTRKAKNLTATCKPTV
jgi:hypothetical protein